MWRQILSCAMFALLGFGNIGASTYIPCTIDVPCPAGGPWYFCLDGDVAYHGCSQQPFNNQICTYQCFVTSDVRNYRKPCESDSICASKYEYVCIKGSSLDGCSTIPFQIGTCDDQCVNTAVDVVPPSAVGSPPLSITEPPPSVAYNNSSPQAPVYGMVNPPSSPPNVSSPYISSPNASSPNASSPSNATQAMPPGPGPASNHTSGGVSLTLSSITGVVVLFAAWLLA